MRLDWQLMRVALGEDGRCPHTAQLQIGVRAAQIVDLALGGVLADSTGGAQLHPDRRTADTPDTPLLQALVAGEPVVPWHALFYNQLGDLPHGTAHCARDLVDAGVWREHDGHRWLPGGQRFADADDAGRAHLRASTQAAVDDPASGHDTDALVLAYLADSSELFGAPSRPDPFDVLHRYDDRLHLGDATRTVAVKQALWAAANDWYRARSGFGINLGGV